MIMFTLCLQIFGREGLSIDMRIDITRGWVSSQVMLCQGDNAVICSFVLFFYYCF